MTPPPERGDGSTTDKPRRIIFCSVGDYPEMQKRVTALGHGDVLVMRSRHIEDGKAVVADAAILDPPSMEGWKL